MKLPIAFRTLVLSLTIVTATAARAQIVSSNPLEYAALIEGNELINAQIESQTKNQLKTAGLQSTMAAEFTQIKKWEDKYSRYLQTAEGFASTLKAGTTLYHDGVHIFLTLGHIQKAVSDNPQGLVSTAAMNNLYIETATELVGVFTLLKDAIAKGGTQNMLTGAERAQTMWELEDKLDRFNKKLRQLYISMRYYTMADVWNRYTTGTWYNDNAHIVRAAYSRWRRAATVASQ